MADADTKTTPGGLRASSVARAFEVMLPAHRRALDLEHNPHLGASSISVKEYCKGTTIAFTTELERQKAEATNEMWVLSWLPADDGNPRPLAVAATTLTELGRWLEEHGLAFGC